MLGIPVIYWLIAYLIISVTIPLIYFRNRQMGIGWIIFFSVMLTPVIGFLIAYSCPRYDGGSITMKNPSISSIIITIILAIIGLGQLFYSPFRTETDLLGNKVTYSEILPSDANDFEIIRWWIFITFTGMAMYTSRIRSFRFDPTPDRTPYKKKQMNIAVSGKWDWENIISYTMSAILLGLLIAVLIHEYL